MKDSGAWVALLAFGLLLAMAGLRGQTGKLIAVVFAPSIVVVVGDGT